MEDEIRDEIIREKQKEKALSARKRRNKRNRILKLLLALLLVIIAAGLVIGGDILYERWKKAKAERKQVPPQRAAPSISGSLDSNDRNTEETASTEKTTGEQKATPGEADVEEKKEQAEFTIDMSFVGDCCMGTDSGAYYEGCMTWCMDNYPTTYFFDNVRYIFEADDFTLANCEGAFSDRDLPMRDKGGPGFWFKSDKKNAQIFADSSIEMVSIDNNHSHDYLEEGFNDTVDALEAAGVKWGYKENILYYEKEGYRIAIVCTSCYGDEYEVEDTLGWLETAKKNSDFQIVFMHGGSEGVSEPDYWKIDAMHRFVDAGADLVIGHHPHVLQPKEIYNGVTIIYSLGNFCFGGNDYPDPYTMIYKYILTIKDGELAGQADLMIPCYVFTGSYNNWQPAVIEDEEEKQMVLDFMNGDRSSLP